MDYVFGQISPEAHLYYHMFMVLKSGREKDKLNMPHPVSVDIPWFTRHPVFTSCTHAISTDSNKHYIVGGINKVYWVFLNRGMG